MLEGGVYMPDRTKNPKKNNSENKKNDSGRPNGNADGNVKENKRPPVFENDNV